MTIRRRRPGSIFIAAALLTAALVTTMAAAKSPQASSSPRMLPAYAHGSITGAGPHSGVRLVLVAWPKGSKVPVGHKVHLKIVGKATSSSSGTYAVHPSVVLPEGLHNLEVMARSSVAVGAFSFPRMIAKGGRALSVGGSASTGPVTANIHMMALPKSGQSPARTPAVACSPLAVKTKEFGPRWVSVGGLYDLMPNGQMKETYSAGASTTMGIGISIPGESGSFSVGGTFTQTASTSEPFKAVTGKIVNQQTPYTFGEYLVCFMSQVQPEVWVLGSHLQNTTAPLIDKCSTFLPQGTMITRQSGTAGTFSAGVSIAKDIGIDLSAQSGYNRNVKIKYTFQAGGGYLCGSNNYASASRWVIMSPLPATMRPAGRTSRSR
jgi:hypothetical protein